MEGGEWKMNRFRSDRDSVKTKKRLNLSVYENRPNLVFSKLKIKSSQCKSTGESFSWISGRRDLGSNPFPDGIIAEPIDSRPEIESAAENEPEIEMEPKNEILSRTIFPFFAAKNIFGLFLRLIIAWLLITNAVGLNGVETAAVGKKSLTSVGNANRAPTVRRTFGNDVAGDNPAGRKLRRHKRKLTVNKNCKEYDITSRAFLADLIFEGTARSRSRKTSGRYVTFVIEKILKEKNGNSLRPKTQIRLHFGGRGNRKSASGARINPLNDCSANSITRGNRAMVNLKFGENYYVFADQFGPMNYTAKGEPIVVNRRNLKSIRSVLSKIKERPPRVLGLQDLNVKITQPLRLSCQVRGRPVPRINWYKDGASLIPSSRVNVTYYRRNSTLEIKSLELRDGGLYECRATSVTGKIAKTSAHVNVWKIYAPGTTDSEKAFHIKKCSVDAYCLNGGQCYFIEHLGEHMCECETGFKGARCEVKEVSAIGIKSYVCGFNVGYSSYYC